MELLVGLGTICIIAAILLAHFSGGTKPVTKSYPGLSRTEYRHILPSAYEAYLVAEREHGTEDFFSKHRREGKG